LYIYEILGEKSHSHYPNEKNWLEMYWYTTRYQKGWKHEGKNVYNKRLTTY